MFKSDRKWPIYIKLAQAFGKYPSFMKAKVVKDRKTGKSRGYGFISFANPDDYIRAMKEMNGNYLGKRPLKLSKSEWKDRFAGEGDLNPN